MEFDHLDVCETCSGSGGKPGTEPQTCSTCQGQGQVAQQGLGGMFRMVTACPTCKGRGTRITHPCVDCSGKGRTSIHRKLRLKIPAGIHHGQAVRVAGEGEPPTAELSPVGAGARGDLHVVVRVKQDERFERDGDNLIYIVPVAFTQLALGATIQVDSINQMHEVSIPAGTQPNEIFSVKNAGLPDLRTGKRGDLVVIVRLSIPTKLSENQHSLLEEYAKTEQIPVHDNGTSFWEKLKDVVTGNKTRQTEDSINDD